MNTEFSKELETIAMRVSGRLEELFEVHGAASGDRRFGTALNSHPELLKQVVQLTLRGGKRLRAALVIHGGALFDKNAFESPEHLDTAAAMELIQTYLLIHDDIIDDDDVRRNGPSVHVALGSNGRSREEAMGLAILAGDLAKALSEVIISDLEVHPVVHRTVRGILSRMHLDVVHGQTLDVTGSADAETIARHKTASYTTIGPLLAGAALAGAHRGQLDSIAACALPLGVAFQLRDDILGIFGDEKVTGKPKATDLRGGKRNWLIEKSLIVSNGKNRKAIDDAWGRPELGDEAIEAATAAIEKCGVRWLAEERIGSLVEQSVRRLRGLHSNGANVDFIEKLAEYIGNREL